MTSQKHQRVGELLLSNRQELPNGFWYWLSDLDGKEVDKKSANKFLLGCILDYQMLSETVWENARRFSEDVLDDPENLWDVISDIPEQVWKSRWRKYSLHRYPMAHERVRRIANEVVKRYYGDARCIREGHPPDVVLYRLKQMRVGPQISRMTVGALIDTGQITGKGDLKADIHITRVLGRVFKGEQISVSHAHLIAKKISTDNPWLLDRPLYLLGRDLCEKSSPKCVSCYLHRECIYASLKL